VTAKSKNELLRTKGMDKNSIADAP